MFRAKIDTVLIDAEALPWVPFAPYSDRVHVKAIRIDPIRGEWTTLLKAPAEIGLPRHHHSGTVQVMTLAGAWKYKEHDWIATRGSFVFETAGSEHTPVGVGSEEIITVNIVQGDWTLLDDSGAVLAVENWKTVMQRYLNYCKAHDIIPVDISSFTA